MIESQEDIDEMLTDLGDELIFSEFTIKGLPGFHLTSLVSVDGSLSDIEKRDFSFVISAKDAKEKLIKIDKKFYITDGIYDYHFKINNNPFPDGSGWVKLAVILTKVSPV